MLLIRFDRNSKFVSKLLNQFNFWSRNSIGAIKNSDFEFRNFENISKGHNLDCWHPGISSTLLEGPATGHCWQALPLVTFVSVTTGRPCHWSPLCWSLLAGPATGHCWQALPLQSSTQAVGSGAVARYLEVFKLLFLAFRLIFTCFFSLSILFSSSNLFEFFLIRSKQVS